MAAQIGGRVQALLVRDNQLVAAGQTLVTIDPRDMQVRADQSLAQRAQAVAQLAQARATLAIRRADLGGAEANVKVAEADLFQAERDFARYRAINPHAVTRQLIDNADAAERSAKAKLDANRQAVAGMQAQIAAAAASVDAAQAAAATADADLANSRLQLSYTRVVAPTAGRVTRRTVELGNYIAPGQALLAIVQPGLWVTANYKETQLTHMRPGQTVKIYVDAFSRCASDRPRGFVAKRHRIGVQRAAGGKRHRQLCESGAAPAGENPVRWRRSGLAAVGAWDVGYSYGYRALNRRKKESTSFLKKRSKRLFPIAAAADSANEQKFFGSFFQKRTAS